jgi:hypothetical protein
MKSPLLLLITSLFFIQFAAHSQSISNNGFENWSTRLFFENPDIYNSSNFYSYVLNGIANVTKSTDAQSGNYALKIETIEVNNEIVEGSVFIGSIEDDNVSGGIPFTEKPDSLKGFAKYNVMNNDTAYVAVLFKKFGAPIGICFVRFYGTQNNYEAFSAPVQWLLPFTPDTIAVAILSSTKFSQAIPGSTIIVDNISFVGATTPFPNGDFENWEEFSSEEPDDWFTSNILSLAIDETSVTKTTDSYEGTYAARIESTLNMFEDTLGLVTNGVFGEDGPIGGMPVDSIPDKLSGYYKYTPVGPDTAIGGLMLYHYNENTGNTELLEEAFIKLPPVDEYTYFEVEVDYFSLPEPDTVNVAFASGNVADENMYFGLGSVLYVDALEITYKPHLVGIDNSAQELVHHVYPNPTSEKICIEFQEILKNDISVTVANSKGALVYQKKISPLATNQFDISVKNFTPGLYFYIIESGKNTFKGKFIVK